MINYYLSENNNLKTVSEPVAGSWVSVIKPTSAEVLSISEQFNLDMDVLMDSLDADERSRIEVDDNYTMILVNIPTIEIVNEKELYNTIPLSIILVDDVVLTICNEDTDVLKPFAENKVREFHTFMKSRFILQILYRTATLFLYYLRVIDKKSDEVESKLHRSSKNRELIELLNLEKSLVYFTTSLRSNEVVLEKLFRNDLVKKYPEDEDLLEDAIVENKQAIEMANIYSGILSGMMDAFASIISNNLNIVMKVLSIITVVMSIPTMIFSAYGMNVNINGVPFAQSPYGFLSIVLLSIVMSVVVAILLVKMKMFK